VGSMYLSSADSTVAVKRHFQRLAKRPTHPRKTLIVDTKSVSARAREREIKRAREQVSKKVREREREREGERESEQRGSARARERESERARD